MKLINGDAITFAATVTTFDMCNDPKYNEFDKKLIVKLSEMVTRVVDICEPVDAIPIDWISDQADAEENAGPLSAAYKHLLEDWEKYNNSIR